MNWVRLSQRLSLFEQNDDNRDQNHSRSSEDVILEVQGTVGMGIAV